MGYDRITLQGVLRVYETRTPYGKYLYNKTSTNARRTTVSCNFMPDNPTIRSATTCLCTIHRTQVQAEQSKAPSDRTPVDQRTAARGCWTRRSQPRRECDRHEGSGGRRASAGRSTCFPSLPVEATPRASPTGTTLSTLEATAMGKRSKPPGGERKCSRTSKHGIRRSCTLDLHGLRWCYHYAACRQLRNQLLESRSVEDTILV